MSFDPKTISAQYALLVSRCDFGQFSYQDVPTNQLSGSGDIAFLGANSKHPYQDYFAPRSASVLKITWQAVYRGTKFNGPPLMVDASNRLIGIAATLDAAAKFLDLIDLRASRDGANPNTYAPYAPGKP